MAFGDNTGYGIQVSGTIPNGGIRIETGCWTKHSDTSFYVPTQLTKVYCAICDGTGRITTVPDISADGYVSASLSASLSGEVVNYVLFGE